MPKYRSLGYHAIQLFTAHLSTARFQQRDIVEYILTKLMSSTNGFFIYLILFNMTILLIATEANQRIAPLWSIFLQQTFSIFMQPAHFMYSALLNFVLLRATFNLSDVPEFYNFFHSTNLRMHKVCIRYLPTFSIEIHISIYPYWCAQEETMWYVQYLRDAINIKHDLTICRRRNVFPLIMAFYTCR